MNILDALLAEHAVMMDLFDHMERVVCAHGSLELMRGTALLVRRAVDAHGAIEETLLLPAFPAVRAGAGPTPMARHQHAQLDAGFDRVLAAPTVEEAVTACITLLEDARNHFLREEESLFPLAARMIPAHKLESLGRAWAEQRKVALRVAPAEA